MYNFFIHRKKQHIIYMHRPRYTVYAWVLMRNIHMDLINLG